MSCTPIQFPNKEEALRPIAKLKQFYTHWRLFYFITALNWGMSYLIISDAKYPTLEAQGDTFTYIYGGPMGTIFFVFLFATVLSTGIILLLRANPFPKELAESCAMLAFLGISVVIVLALLGPTIMEADAFVLFECDRFMIRCKELHSENIFYLAMNHFHTDKLSAHLSIGKNVVHLSVNNEILYTHHPSH